MRDAALWPLLPTALAVALAYVGLFAGAEVLRRRWQVAPETTRALVHVLGALLAVPLPLVLGRRAGVALAVALAGALVVSRRRGLLPSVHGVRRRTVGEVLFPLGIALVAVVARDYGQYALGVLVLGLADAAAGVVGARFGRPRRWWPASATAAGSVAFLLVTVVVALGAASVVGAQPVALVLPSALVVTLVEALLTGGWDDLAVPSAAALAFAWMF